MPFQLSSTNTSEQRRPAATDADRAFARWIVDRLADDPYSAALCEADIGHFDGALSDGEQIALGARVVLRLWTRFAGTRRRSLPWAIGVLLLVRDRLTVPWACLETAYPVLYVGVRERGAL